jgi:putative component of toxin-antitoxin plasmid stabilization module
MRFSYFDRLSAKDKRIYLRSDAIRAVNVPDAPALGPLVDELRGALEAGRRVRTSKAANALVLALCKQLKAPPVRVRVREVRPSWDGGELHGLYTFALEPGDVPEIEVWMRTVAQGRIVRFRTFLRTLLHEVCHHLDATIFQMKESFHTHGFFARESSLTKQLLGETPRSPRSPAKQLDLFGGSTRPDRR